MMANSELIAKTAEVGGSCMAFGCGLLRFMANNHDALTTLCGFGGLTIAAAGFGVSAYFQFLRNRRELEMHRRLLERSQQTIE